MNKIKLFAPVGRYFTPAEVFVGPGSIGVIGALNAARTAVLLSPSIAKDETARASIEKALRRTLHTLIPLPSGEPILAQLQPALKQVTAFRPDWIIAVGGGAAMDAGKLIWAFYEHPALSEAHWERTHALPALRGKARFVAAPTTAGSGSEASSTATFQLANGARKAFLVSHELLPDLAILDPALMRGTPPKVVAAAALDALAHAVEGYVSPYANPMTDAAAEGAVRRILANLAEAVSSPDNLAVRSEVLTAAFLAGTVQNFAVPGIAHATAHQLAYAGVPHAVSTGSLLAASIAINGRASPEAQSRYEALGRAAGLGGAEGLQRAIASLSHSQGLDRRFAEATADVDWTEAAFIDGVLGDPCARANPAPCTAGLVAALIEEAAA